MKIQVGKRGFVPRLAIGTIAIVGLGVVASGVAPPAVSAGPQGEGAGAPNRVEFHPPQGRSAMPFSESVRVGSLLFLSGQIGVVMTEGGRGLPPGGIGPETKQTLENIRQALDRRGLTMDDVVKCTVMLADISEWAAMNGVYSTFFSKRFPARSAFGTSGLALGARVEIECIAAYQE